MKKNGIFVLACSVAGALFISVCVIKGTEQRGENDTQAVSISFSSQETQKNTESVEYSQEKEQTQETSDHMEDLETSDGEVASEKKEEPSLPAGEKDTEGVTQESATAVEVQTPTRGEIELPFIPAR